MEKRLAAPPSRLSARARARGILYGCILYAKRRVYSWPGSDRNQVAGCWKFYCRFIATNLFRNSPRREKYLTPARPLNIHRRNASALAADTRRPSIINFANTREHAAPRVALRPADRGDSADCTVVIKKLASFVLAVRAIALAARFLEETEISRARFNVLPRESNNPLDPRLRVYRREFQVG